MKAIHYCLAGLILACPIPASAWDSQCWPQGTVDFYCAKADDCPAGVAIIGSILRGEHEYITREALGIAGLAGLADRNAMPFYDANEPASPWLPIVEPGKPGEVVGRVADSLLDAITVRKTKLSELSQLPDVSYGLSDFALGNTHCLAKNGPEDPDTCHTFMPHMGAVNSTHFSPQNRHVYARYHRAAKAVAEPSISLPSA